MHAKLYTSMEDLYSIVVKEKEDLYSIVVKEKRERNNSLSCKICFALLLFFLLNVYTFIKC